jgi:hypothetical protein
MPSQIDSKAKRNRLAKRSEPYWNKLILGGFLGCRVGSKGGTWIARHRSEEGGQHYKSLNLAKIIHFYCLPREVLSHYLNGFRDFHNHLTVALKGN